MTKTPRPGPGCFQWNTGGWFGSQCGATVWMLLLGLLTVHEKPWPGIIAIAAFAMVNAIGTTLWLRRDRIAPYPALQALIASAGVAALAVCGTFDWGEPVSPMQPRVHLAAQHLYRWLLVFPGLMLLFHFRERNARRAGRPTAVAANPQNPKPPGTTEE